MTDKELRRLSRIELIDIIYELQKQNEERSKKIRRLQDALRDKQIRISNAGSIAEAALQLNEIFEAAQAAADQYLDSVRMVNNEAQEILDDAERQRESVLREAREEAEEILHSAKAQAQKGSA